MEFTAPLISASGHFVLEGITVCTFFLCRIGLMSTYMDLIQCTVICIGCMVHTVVNGTLNALVFVLIHH